MRLTGLLALTALAACGSEQRDDSLGMRLIGTFTGEEVAVPLETPGFTAQLIAENPQNFMVVSASSVGLNAPARIIRVNGAEETWQAQTGATFAFDDGVLVATRGLIGDLLVISSGGVKEAIAAGGGEVTRRLERLDSRDQLSVLDLSCTITRDGAESVNLGLREVELTKFTETCRSQALQFENAYWVDATGAVLQSRQFVSVSVAYLRSNRL